MENTKFLTDSNIIPNIQIPDGCKLHFNETMGRWALRNCKGFSTKYLKKNSFVPHSKYEEVAIEPLFEDDVDTTKTRKTKKNNRNLTTAKREKNDDFYTTFDDISKEMNHYKKFLKGKTIYCPCDKVFNEGRSEFVNYFTSLFHTLGLKKVIFTQYNPNGVGYKSEWELEKCGYKWEYNGEFEDNRFIDESEIDFYPLKGNGSFNSRECREIMKECDIVITNPPFSRFRDFIEQLITKDKKFIIIGPENAITYKEIFPFIKENKIWLGFSKPSVFRIPVEYRDENNKSQFIKDGVVYQKFGNICWFTNLEHEKRIEKIPLIKKYNPDEYPHYDNYDAIDTNSVKKIPADYNGVIGVPITYLQHHNPNQFEIIKFRKGNDDKDLTINGKCPYFRILIRKVLEHEKRVEKIPLTKRYTPEEYPKYDNYDAIEVGSYKDIPVDYDGVMGVPITYLQHHNPNQFEIVGAEKYTRDYFGKKWSAKLFGKNIYKRILIKRISK